MNGRRIGATVRRLRGKNRPLSVKIALPLVFFAVFWAFAAWVVSTQGVAVLAANTLNSDTSTPGLAVVGALQQERRATVVYLASPTSETRGAMQVQRTRTDAAVKRFRALATGSSVRRVATDVMLARISQAVQRLDSLGSDRTAIDGGRLNGTQAATAFDSAIDPVFAVFNATSSALNDSTITQDSRTLNSLTRAKELLSREDALLAGSIAGHRLTGADQARFAKLVGAREFQHSEAVSALPAADRARDDKLVRGPAFTRLAQLENRVIDYRHRGMRPPVTAAQWQRTTQPAMDGLQQTVVTDGDVLLKQSTPVAVTRILQFVAVAVLGAIVLAAMIYLSISTVRDLVRRLHRLQSAARELADVRLPGVVERISHGEPVDVAAEVPPLDFGTDEIGQVGAAFNAAQRTAVEAAVGQAAQRRGTRDTLQTIARRIQTRLHRQLRVLDELERRGDLSEQVLRPVFQIDHLSTQLRRYAENLLVLSGATPARGWRRPVPLLDVVRGAVGEVRDYQRVSVASMDGIALAGRAALDLSHLLAELIENAVSFSDPRTTVHVRGQFTNHGYAVEIEDRGLGMDEARLAAVNQRIREPGEFNLASSDSHRDQLGLHVVGQLAERYTIQVTLTRNVYSGVTVVVLVPNDLLPEEAPLDSGPDPDADEFGSQPALVPSGGGREERPRRAIASVPAAAPRGAGARRAGDDDPDDDGRGDPAPKASHTPNGLPIRAPQATYSAPSASTAGDSRPGRSPRSAEQVRDFVGAAVQGTRQARAAARARRTDDGNDSQNGSEEK
ncbi:MAG TPA: nitrate- and nitrite sensing domain-containing protein [Streptosporangiaceae bacterium]